MSGRCCWRLCGCRFGWWGSASPASEEHALILASPPFLLFGRHSDLWTMKSTRYNTLFTHKKKTLIMDFYIWSEHCTIFDNVPLSIYLLHKVNPQGQNGLEPIGVKHCSSCCWQSLRTSAWYEGADNSKLVMINERCGVATDVGVLSDRELASVSVGG